MVAKTHTNTHVYTHVHMHINTYKQIQTYRYKFIQIYAPTNTQMKPDELYNTTGTLIH